MNKFSDLCSAGRDLAVELNEYSGSKDTFVLGIASGGVPVAWEVAKELQLPFELLLIRRLLAPYGPEHPISGVNIAGTLVLDDELGQPSATSSTGQDYSIADGLRELSRRERVCRGNRPPIIIAGHNVLLVDNGIHTGQTILTAIRALRKLEVTQIVVAVPVGDPDSRGMIEVAADRVVCLEWLEKFGHVGLWYQDFSRPSEEQIRELFEEAVKSTSTLFPGDHK